jgi:hypothetical protein
MTGKAIVIAPMAFRQPSPPRPDDIFPDAGIAMFGEIWRKKNC